MGCDIHAWAERKTEAGWKALDIPEPFADRSYSIFAFLAGVRNYSAVAPIAGPRGMPEDASERAREDFDSWGVDGHTPSWLTVDELQAFDYGQTMEDRRVTRQIAARYWSGGETVEVGGGEVMTYRDFLGEWFFEEMDRLRAAGADRIVFWFDN